MINGSSTFWSIQFLASLIFLILVLQSLLDIFSNFFRLFDVPDWLHFLVAASEYFSVKLKFSDHAVFNYVKYYAYVLLSVIGCFIIYLVGDYIYSDVTRKDLKIFLINCATGPQVGPKTQSISLWPVKWSSVFGNLKIIPLAPLSLSFQNFEFTSL